MPLIGGDILRITAFQALYGVQCLNTFFYELVSNTGDANYSDIATQFALQWGLEISPNLVTNHRMHTVKVENLSNGIDFFDLITVKDGTIAGEALPPFNGFYFKLVRSTLETRNGRKTIAGVPETSNAGSGTSPGALTNLNDAATWMGSMFIWDVGGTPDFELQPVIVGRINTAAPGDPPVYELDLSKINPIQNAQYIRISSQNTRKS